MCSGGQTLLNERIRSGISARSIKKAIVHLTLRQSYYGLFFSESARRVLMPDPAETVLFSDPQQQHTAKNAAEGTRKINADIAELAASSGDKPLVDLIRAGVQQRQKRRQRDPRQAGVRLSADLIRSEEQAERHGQQQAEHGKLRKMPELAEQRMHGADDL